MSNTPKTNKHRVGIPKSTGIQSKTSHDLRRLLSLLAKNTRRPEVAVLNLGKARGTNRSQSSHHKDSHSHKTESNSSSEALELDKFSVVYKDQRCFSNHPLQKLFSDLLISLLKNRLCSDWIDHAAPECVLRVLICLRILVRDTQLQKLFHQHHGITSLARYLESVSESYISCGEEAYAGQRLVTMTYMFQKMSASEVLRGCIMESGVHRTLVNLLSTPDSSVLLGALLALTTLAENPECREQIGELQIVENLLIILQEYDLLSKRMCGELLRLLSPVPCIREQLRCVEGLPVLLSLLHGHHYKLLWSVCWVLVQLCQEAEARLEIRSWGGVPQLLRLLNSDRRYVSDRSSIEALSSANAAGRIHRQHVREELSPQEEQENISALQSACCTALTELSLDDSCAHHIVQENGVFIIAKLILPQFNRPNASLQSYAFRTLRFLFSVERNRHLFKRLFPTDLFELFIDIGHYVRDLTAYQPLQTKVSLYSEEELDSLRDSIVAVDQNRPPLRVICGYSILDHLGTGAFGTVFKVRKQSSQTLLALKEVNLHNPAFGKDKKSRDSNVEKIISELSIIREQMAHPNVVKYYKTFLEGEKLYIVMELIEGVPLADHFTSLKEKNQTFTEERVWNIFIQMCLALRYLHKDKRIVHRDLSPNNIMLGERDKVTITDFGLAKQKQENSKLTSVVGTILYSCPEVVKNEPYGEKADVWALGCVFYQMVTLQPPFYSNNMLSLASKIVEAKYDPVDSGTYSERVTHMIRWCLSPDPEQRPDIVQVSSHISDLMMTTMDLLYTSHNALERRAERDRKRAQRYFLERNESRAQRYHSAPSQERSILKSNPPTPREQIQDDVSDEEVELLDMNSPAPSGEDCEFKPKLCVTPRQLEREECASAKIKSRPGTMSSGLCVSQRKLKQIDDPINRLLLQLHKIIFITQLPPAPHHNTNRRIIERFKKSLFNTDSDPYNLKVELSKLLQTSSELMELGSSSDWWPLVQHNNTDSTADGVTYEQMQGIIEELLEENSYYDSVQSRFMQRGQDQEKK